MTAALDTIIPADYQDLLRRPLYGVLATVRPDNTAQASPMWYLFDEAEGQLHFTHTTKRAKYRNLQANPSMSLAVYDPERPYRYLEVRGRLVEVLPDPTGAFYVTLGRRYGNVEQQPPADSPDRVILVMSIDHSVRQ